MERVVGMVFLFPISELSSNSLVYDAVPYCRVVCIVPVKMGHYCSVPNCKSGGRKGCKKLSLFKAPEDSTLRQKWNNAIPRQDRAITGKDHVFGIRLAKHFTLKLICNSYYPGKSGVCGGRVKWRYLICTFGAHP